jgi:hypothetical protein
VSLRPVMHIPLQTQLITFEALSERSLKILYLTNALLECSLYSCGSTGQARISGAVRKTFGWSPCHSLRLSQALGGY